MRYFQKGEFKKLLDTQGFNSHIKIAGKNVTLRRFNKLMYFGYDTSKARLVPKGKGDPVRSRENFNKSTTRARNNIFDIISSNIGKIPTYDGLQATPKFVTLTFSENVTDVKEANYEFTKFNKRLSYDLYNVRKNVLKYICVPEFQKRGAVHFHVLYFNLPYIEFDNLGYIWGQGFVFIESTKDNIKDFAKYICKYISKTNSEGEDNYDLYIENNMLNQKRYFCSRGLHKPSLYKLNILPNDYESLKKLLNQYHTGSYTSTGEYLTIQNENYELDNKDILQDRISNLTDKHFEFYRRRYVTNSLKVNQTENIPIEHPLE